MVIVDPSTLMTGDMDNDPDPETVLSALEQAIRDVCDEHTQNAIGGRYRELMGDGQEWTEESMSEQVTLEIVASNTRYGMDSEYFRILLLRRSVGFKVITIRTFSNVDEAAKFARYHQQSRTVTMRMVG